MKPQKSCPKPVQEIQIDFGGPNKNEKDREIHFLACIDRFYRYLHEEFFDKTNGANVVNFWKNTSNFKEHQVISD